MKRCMACGEGQVTPAGGEGRVSSYKFMNGLEVPADLMIPTCDHCGEEWMDDDVARELDAAMEGVYRKRLSAMAIAALEALSGVIRQGALERKLGLAQGYLTKLKKGRKTPSADLALHLASIALNPEVRLHEIDEVLELGFSFALSQRSSMQSVVVEELLYSAAETHPGPVDDLWLEDYAPKERGNVVPIAA